MSNGTHFENSRFSWVSWAQQQDLQYSMRHQHLQIKNTKKDWCWLWLGCLAWSLLPWVAFRPLYSLPCPLLTHPPATRRTRPLFRSWRTKEDKKKRDEVAREWEGWTKRATESEGGSVGPIIAMPSGTQAESKHERAGLLTKWQTLGATTAAIDELSATSVQARWGEKAKKQIKDKTKMNRGWPASELFPAFLYTRESPNLTTIIFPRLLSFVTFSEFT